MKPKIDSTKFGQVIIEGHKYDHDVIIRLDGQVKKRKKKLSKKIYGTSHIVSLEEAQYIYEEGMERLIIGTGQTGLVELSDQAAGYFETKKCPVDLRSTPDAIHLWNDARGAIVALLHVTC